MDSQSTLRQTKKYRGQVKWFNKKNGYGFIVNIGDDSEELFVHHSGIKAKTECYVLLTPGEYVEFEISQGKNGKQCSNVTGIEGGTLMCDVHEEVRTDRKQFNKKKKPFTKNIEDQEV